MKSFFILPLNVHLIKLLKLKATPKLSMMKLYLKQHKNKNERQKQKRKIKHLTKTQALPNLLFLRPKQSSVVVAMTNEPRKV